MQGPLGQLPVSNYGLRYSLRHQELESQIADWLASKPGVFSSRDSVNPYAGAFAAFIKFCGEEHEQHAFEIALSRAGERMGSVITGGEVLWLLLLPRKTNKEVENAGTL
jgi:hypothetical protein